MFRRCCVWFCCFVCVVFGNRLKQIWSVWALLFRVNVFTLDQYIDIFTTPLLDDTLNFVVQTCLISERSWVDWDLVGQTRGNLFQCWLEFCRGRTPNTVLTAALLVVSRRLLRSCAMPTMSATPNVVMSATPDVVT